MRSILAFLFLAVSAVAQTLTPTAAPTTVSVGKSVNIALTWAAGSTSAAALQWASTLPASSTIVWTIGAAATAAGKTLACSADGTTCVVYGLNTTAISNGIVATGALSLAPAIKGASTFTISFGLGADAAGIAIAVTGGAAGFFVASPFDLNGDGLVNGADLSLAVQQVTGTSPCTTADFNADGKCNVIDLLLLVLDSMSPNP